MLTCTTLWCQWFQVPDKDSADGSNAWKYEKIYDAVKVKKTEGFESPFSGVKGPRNFVIDVKNLKIQEELGRD